MIAPKTKKVSTWKIALTFSENVGEPLGDLVLGVGEGDPGDEGGDQAVAEGDVGDAEGEQAEADA